MKRINDRDDYEYYEEEFDVEIPTEELEKFTTIGSIADYMRKNSVE